MTNAKEAAVSNTHLDNLISWINVVGWYIFMLILYLDIIYVTYTSSRDHEEIE